MALNYNNVADYLRFDLGADLTDDWTYFQWYKMPSSQTNWGSIAFNFDRIGNRYRDSYLTDVAGRIQIALRNASGSDYTYTFANAFTLSAWNFMSVQFSTSAAAGDKIRFWKGTLTSPPSEVSELSYTDQSGALVSADGFDMYIGSTKYGTSAHPKDLAVFGYYDRLLTAGELNQLWARPHVPTGADCAILGICGLHGVSAIDFSGRGISTTVSGLTVSEHVSLGPYFGCDIGLPYVVAAGGQNFIPLWWNQKLYTNR